MRAGQSEFVVKSRRDMGTPWNRSNRLYRLIDGCCEPHRQLDSAYSSLEEALSDAIAWIETTGVDSVLSLIGVEVRTGNGDWRTLRLPGPLLCPLLCPLPG
jgi:hypothetical protein